MSVHAFLNTRSKKLELNIVHKSNNFNLKFMLLTSSSFPGLCLWTSGIGQQILCLDICPSSVRHPNETVEVGKMEAGNCHY